MGNACFSEAESNKGQIRKNCTSVDVSDVVVDVVFYLSFFCRLAVPAFVQKYLYFLLICLLMLR